MLRPPFALCLFDFHHTSSNKALEVTNKETNTELCPLIIDLHKPLTTWEMSRWRLILSRLCFTCYTATPVPSQLMPVVLSRHCSPIGSNLHLHFRHLSGTRLQSDLQWAQTKPQLSGCHQSASPQFGVNIKLQIGFCRPEPCLQVWQSNLVLESSMKYMNSRCYTTLLGLHAVHKTYKHTYRVYSCKLTQDLHWFYRHSYTNTQK